MEKELIDALNEYYACAFDGDVMIDKLPDDGIVHLAYTETCAGQEIQVDFDINNLKYLNYIDGELVLEEKRDSIQEFIVEIANCGFSDIVWDCLNA